MTRLLLAQDSLVGKMPIAANLRRDTEFETFRQAVLAALPSFADASTDLNTEYGPLQCWWFDEGDTIGGVTPPTNTFYYTPYDYPVQNDLIRTRKVVRFMTCQIPEAGSTGIMFGLSLEPDTPVGAYPGEPIGDYYEVQRILPWVITIPNSLMSMYAAEDVLIAGQQGFSSDFLKWLAPDRSVVGDNFLAMDVLNIIIVTSLSGQLFSTVTWPNYVNGIIRSYFPANTVLLPSQSSILISDTEYGDVDLAGSYWLTTATPGFSAAYATDKARFVDAYPIFPRHRTVLYYDQHISGNRPDSGGSSGSGPTQLHNLPGQQNVATRITGFLAAIASDLSAYEVSYGGVVDWQTTTSADFTSLIDTHFGF